MRTKYFWKSFFLQKKNTTHLPFHIYTLKGIIVTMKIVANVIADKNQLSWHSTTDKEVWRILRSNKIQY